MGEMSFQDFDKITDTLLYLSNDVTLTICLQLNRKSSKDNNQISNFHSEYHYSGGLKGYSIKRTVQPYFAINDLKDFKNGVILKANDVWLLKMLIDNKIMPWFVGNTRVFFFDDNKQLQIKGKWDIQEFRLSDYSFLAFAPIVIRYEDGTDKEGIRLLLNSKDRFVDITIDTFISFYYFITNTDLYNAGANMANYVKTMPYDVGMINMNGAYERGYEDDDWRGAKKSGHNFFNK